MDTVNLVVDADEHQLASRFRDAGQVDAQPQVRTMFMLGRLEPEIPLGVPQEGPARRGIPVIFVEETTEGTGADKLGLVKHRFHV
ncbi:hypothetical protein [Deinococcus sp. Leaf326]|uniref:hypothetical protein n=1 Tax=Deinococcus sp. Leaf326 TaxID=1736338 RepID=UPI0009E9D230|nr:hypothetical protein [Deinococcus sp. Leaf326]